MVKGLLIEVRPRSLRRGFSWTLAGNVVFAGCQWAMLVVLAKLVPPGLVGQFGLALAITTPVVVFANLNLRAMQATDARGEFAFGEYARVRALMLALACAAVGAILTVGRTRPETVLVVALVALAKVF